MEWEFNFGSWLWVTLCLNVQMNKYILYFKVSLIPAKFFVSPMPFHDGNDQHLLEEVQFCNEKNNNTNEVVYYI